MSSSKQGASATHAASRTSWTAGRPLLGVFETLAEQHRHVLTLLREAGSVDVVSTRRERWLEARRQLLSHEHSESRVVYAALQGHEAARTMLQQHRDQVTELEATVEELDSDDGSDRWIERLRDVMAMVDDHVRDEEQDFFPLAQRLLGEGAARDLDEQLQSVQRDFLHPPSK